MTTTQPKIKSRRYRDASRFADLVREDIRECLPDNQRAELLLDVPRWLATLKEFRDSAERQMERREAEMTTLRGSSAYDLELPDYRNWRERTESFRSATIMRLFEVAALPVADGRPSVEALLLAVNAVLSVPADEDIPSDLWDALEAAYHAVVA